MKSIKPPLKLKSVLMVKFPDAVVVVTDPPVIVALFATVTVPLVLVMAPPLINRPLVPVAASPMVSLRAPNASVPDVSVSLAESFNLVIDRVPCN